MKPALCDLFSCFILAIICGASRFSLIPAIEHFSPAIFGFVQNVFTLLSSLIVSMFMHFFGPKTPGSKLQSVRMSQFWLYFGMGIVFDAVPTLLMYDAITTIPISNIFLSLPLSIIFHSSFPQLLSRSFNFEKAKLLYLSSLIGGVFLALYPLIGVRYFSEPSQSLWLGICEMIIGSILLGMQPHYIGKFVLVDNPTTFLTIRSFSSLMFFGFFAILIEGSFEIQVAIYFTDILLWAIPLFVGIFQYLVIYLKITSMAKIGHVAFNYSQFFESMIGAVICATVIGEWDETRFDVILFCYCGNLICQVIGLVIDYKYDQSTNIRFVAGRS